MSEAATTPTPPAAVPDFAAEHGSKGKVIQHEGDNLTFRPSGTNYELHLDADGFDGPVDKLLKGIVKVRARKLYSVPSGGNFIAPILGEPRTIQGRVVAGNDRVLLVHAGCSVLVELPKTADAIDLHSGTIESGMMVNVVCFPGANFSAL